METTIKVDNLKCGGCANTIVKKLLLIPEIYKVNVFPDRNEVSVAHENIKGLNNAKEELRKLGYPETGTSSAVSKITSSIKSYLSCAVGKISEIKNAD